jgi:hypothetical protein
MDNRPVFLVVGDFTGERIDLVGLCAEFGWRLRYHRTHNTTISASTWQPALRRERSRALLHRCLSRWFCTRAVQPGCAKSIQGAHTHARRAQKHEI